MNKLLVLTLILSAGIAQAAQITLLETEVRNANYFDVVETRFQMDNTTGEGYAVVQVNQERFAPPHPGPIGCDPFGRCYPLPGNQLPQYVTIFEKSVRVEGLAVHGKRVVYAGANGDVDCGTMGVSRVLRRPTIFLSGKCSLSGSLDRSGKLTMVLTTKQ